MTAAPMTAQEKRECAEREVRQRRRVYPRLIEAGRMTAQKAAREIELMEAIAADYRRQEEAARLL